MSVAAVTGGSGRIGAAIARELAPSGHQVAVLDLPEHPTGEFTFVPLDVREHGRIEAALDEIHDHLGLCTIWINNAGLAMRRPALEVTPEEWSHVLDVNLTRAFFCAQAWARRLVAAKKPGRPHQHRIDIRVGRGPPPRRLLVIEGGARQPDTCSRVRVAALRHPSQRGCSHLCSNSNDVEANRGGS